MTVGDNLHTVLAFLVSLIANVTLLSLRQVLAEVKRGFPAWFGLCPHLLLDTMGVLAVLGGGDTTKVAGIDPSHWKKICGEFSIVFEFTGTLPDRAI